MKLVLCVMFSTLCFAQSRTYRVEFEHRVYEVEYMSTLACLDISGSNRSCVPQLRSKSVFAWVKVIKLNRTPVREWGPYVDSWSVGVARVSVDERPLDVVRELVKK